MRFKEPSIQGLTLIRIAGKVRGTSNNALLLTVALACLFLQSGTTSRADDQVTSQVDEMEPAVPASAAIEFCGGAGISDHFWPNPQVPPTGERSAGAYQVRLRAHYRSIGGVLSVQRFWGAFGNTIDGGEASHVSLQIAASYHVLFLKDRLRLEALAGFTHDRDGVHAYHSSDKYDSILSELGYMLGGDLVIKIVEGVRLHGMFTHSEYTVDIDRVKAEVLLRLSPLGPKDLPTDARLGEFYLIGGVQHARKQDDRIDRVYYFGLGIGNWHTN